MDRTQLIANFVFGIKISAFQIGGGIVLLLFALSMIFGESKPEEEVRLAADHTQTAVFPLAIPSIAGPGAKLGAVLLTENHRFSWVEQLTTSVVMLSVLGITLICMLAASTLYRFVGDAGASVISRVMGLILASVAVSSVLEGVKAYFAV